MDRVVEKKRGLRHFFAAASYSWGGFTRLLRESAFRQEILFFLVAVLLFAVIGASLAEFLTLVILCLLLFGFEALNTAIEELVDRISPEISAVGKNAKDLGSFAVLCLLASTSLFIVFVIARHLVGF